MPIQVITRWFVLLCGMLLITACDRITITHSPAVAKNNEQVTFTATADTTATNYEIQIIVNAALVKTCTSSPCVYVGGPYPAYQGTTVSFLANYIEHDCSISCDASDGYNYFAITDTNYNWSQPYMPARWSGSTADNEDLVLHMASDYVDNGKDFEDFVDDVTNKIYNVFGAQTIVKDNLSKMNIWVYNKEAEADGCGTVHSDAAADMPWRNDDGVLHDDTFRDCTNGGLTHFSAEGFNTKAFLHESGHGVFGLGDEYCGDTSYFQPANEPNIWDLESTCETEQNNKGRDPNACYQFCSNQGGWWGTHTGTTVMVNGMTGESWGVEGEERVKWFFDNL